MDLGIITKKFLEEYFILIVNSMYGNVNADILWLILIAKCVINKCNLKRSRADSCIFYKKDDNGKLELTT